MKHKNRLQPILLLPFLALLFTCACSSAVGASPQLSITIQADGDSINTSLPAGVTVSQALHEADLSLGELDRLQPAQSSILDENTTITITRVIEEFLTETEPLPFTRQYVHSESLPEGELVLLQPGENGLEEITYSIISEDGVVTSRSISSRIILTAPQSEILLLGIHPGFMPATFDGIIAYVDGGNAWALRGSSHLKEPLVLSGDLDSRVFELSPDGRWLLYSRAESESDSILNTLWITSTESPDTEPIYLDIQNVIHFAGWAPRTEGDGYRIAYSTVEPRASAPGWQADNNLRILSLTSGGRLLQTEIVLPKNPGGQYGWWGTSYEWAPDGAMLAFTRPDAVGITDPLDPGFTTLLEVSPFEADSDYVWMPEISWSADSQVLLINVYNEPASRTGTGSFNVLALDIESGASRIVMPNSGLFSYPTMGTAPASKDIFLLSPIDSYQPLHTRYALVQMKQDGEYFTILYPQSGEAGLSPHPIQSSPSGDAILFIRDQSMWILNLISGDTMQLTYSGQITANDWK